MKFLIYLLVLGVFSFPVVAEQAEKIDGADSAVVWLKQLSDALNTLNFSTSFVVVKNNHAEPYHWFHGVTDQGVQLEILSSLNGARRDTLRKGNIVSYIEPELPPYSVSSSQLRGPIPNVLSGDIETLLPIYNLNLVGKSRILGRTAQLIRIVSKDDERHGHWLWLDNKTGLLLKMAIATRTGQLLEQVQFTHLDITQTPADSLIKLQSNDLPKVLEIPKGYQQQNLLWEVKWLPQGFVNINSNRHRISSTKQPVEFKLFSDGLVDVSVYVTRSQEQRQADFVLDGATVAFNQANNGIEISVVGKIPSKTAKKIADSIVILPKALTP